MTKEDIKDALQACVNCPYKDVEICYDTLNNDARELIIAQENEIERLKAEMALSYTGACKLRAATHIFEEWLKEKNALIAELRDIIQQYENMYPCRLYQERLKIVLTTIRRCEQTTFDDAKKYKITDKEELKID